MAAQKPQVATTVLSKILAAQQKQLPADDGQIAITYLAFANVHITMGNEQAALSDYQRAFDIDKLYRGEAVEADRIPKEYFELLRKDGKSTEADRLEALKTTPQQNMANVRLRREQSAKRLKVDIPTLKTEYEKAKANAPYSADTRLLLTQLGYRAATEKDWTLAIDCGAIQLEMDQHFAEPTAKITKDYEALIDLCIQAEKADDGKNWVQKLANTPGVDAIELIRYQQKLLKEYIRGGRLEEASKMLKELWRHAGASASGLCRCERDLLEAWKNAGKDVEEHAETIRLFELHSQWIANITSADDAIFFSALGINAGQKKWIPELLTKGETLVTKGTDRFFYWPRFAALWRKVGNEKHADELSEKLEGSFDGVHKGPPDQDRGKVATVQTKTGLDFPAPQFSTVYSVNFAALASSSLTFDNNARVSVENPGEISFAGTYGELKTAQHANHSGNLSFVTGSSPGLPIVPAATYSIEPRPGRPTKLPAISQLPFKQALIAPSGFHNSLPSLRGEGTQIKLRGGSDYRVSELEISSLQVDGGGCARLLISEDSTATKPVFRLHRRGLVNADIENGRPQNGSEIELWYGGTGTIRLEADSIFNGIIYAPKARIEIGPGNAIFRGAMIARDIVVSGDARIYWNPNLANWKGDLNLH